MPSSNIVHMDQIYYQAFLCLFALLKKAFKGHTFMSDDNMQEDVVQ
jgi:hypothetical protein